jgi:hypothetical protein
MRDGSSEPGPAPTVPAAGSEATRTLADRQPPVDDPAGPAAHIPTEGVPPRTPTEVVRPGPEVPVTLTADQAGLMPRHAGHGGLPPEIVRYGPGVPAVPPAGGAELTAEHVWRNTRPAGPSRPWARLARISGWALTVILLAASGVLLYLRFHHVPLQVTRVAIVQQTANGCGVDVTGRIATNGSAGTVSYQWLFRPGLQSPQPLSQSVVAGQHAMYVTVAVEGQGQGSASQTVTLQVLSPDPGGASAAVAVRCP